MPEINSDCKTVECPKCHAIVFTLGPGDDDVLRYDTHQILGQSQFCIASGTPIITSNSKPLMDSSSSVICSAVCTLQRLVILHDPIVYKQPERVSGRSVVIEFDDAEAADEFYDALDEVIKDRRELTKDEQIVRLAKKVYRMTLEKFARGNEDLAYSLKGG